MNSGEHLSFDIYLPNRLLRFDSQQLQNVTVVQLRGSQSGWRAPKRGLTAIAGGRRWNERKKRNASYYLCAVNV